MLLTTAHVLRPVTSMGVLVVEETTDTELFGGSAVPAGPVPGAGGFVAKDAIEPITVFSGDGWI